MKQSKVKEILPNAAYTTKETASLLKVNPQAIREKKKELGGRKLGKSYIFLGENILKFLRSETNETKS
jgi:hypothetical protein